MLFAFYHVLVVQLSGIGGGDEYFVIDVLFILEL